jgi:ribonuclease G
MAEAPILIIDRINSDLERVLKRTKKLCLTHTPCAAYLTKGFHHYVQNGILSIKWVKIIPRDAYTYLEYHFYDKTGNVIKD